MARARREQGTSKAWNKAWQGRARARREHGKSKAWNKEVKNEIMVNKNVGRRQRV
jgi:hypothetical protein